MPPKPTLFVLPLSQSISLFSFLVLIVSIWIHMEIRVAEVQVEIVNIKQDLMIHKSENRKDFETLRNEIHTDTREILQRMDEIWMKGNDK
ncbi:MAG: hypothetical protein Q8M08_16020 [Bacteroidales bacterium]|nr:hypothetical protein [Bacteroidales bacterium]